MDSFYTKDKALKIVYSYLNREAARNFNNPADFNAILKSLNITKEDFLRHRGEIEKKDTAGLKINSQTSGMPELYEPIINYLTWVELHGISKNKDKSIKVSLTHNEFDFFHDMMVEGRKTEIEKIVKNDNVPLNQLKQLINKKNTTRSQKSEKLTKEELEDLNRYKTEIKLSDGWIWAIPLDKAGKLLGGSTLIGKLQGHCGNGGGMPGDKIYVLRKNILGLIPQIGATVIVNGEGKIRESKSAFNKKIDINKHGLHFLELLKSPQVKGLTDQGAYASDFNIHMSDFIGSPLEAQAKELIKNKPELITNKFDKYVFTIKEKIKDKNPEEVQKVIDEEREKFKTDKKITLVHLRALYGKIPFTEQELAEFIKSGRLSFQDFLSTDTNLFTVPIQKEFINKSTANISYLMFVDATVPKSPVDKNLIIQAIDSSKDFKLTKIPGVVGDSEYSKDMLEYLQKNIPIFSSVLKKDPRALLDTLDIPEDQISPLLEKHNILMQGFAEGLKKDPKAMLRIHPQQGVPLLEKHDILMQGFAEALKKGEGAIKYIPEDQRVPLLEKHDILMQGFAEGLKRHPGGIRDIPEDQRVPLLEKHNILMQGFAEGLKKGRGGMLSIPEGQRVPLLEKHNILMQGFAEGLKKDPGGIEYIPEGQGVPLLEKHGILMQGFAEGLKRDPELYLKYIPYEQRAPLLEKNDILMQGFAEALKKDRAIRYIPEDQIVPLLEKHDILMQGFAEGLKRDPGDIRDIPEDQIVPLLEKHNILMQGFAEGLKKDPKAISWIHRDRREHIKNLTDAYLSKKEKEPKPELKTSSRSFKVIYAYLMG